MTDWVTAYPQLLWLVAFALYAIGAVRLLQPGYLLLVEAGGGLLVPVLDRVPFELLGRELYAPGLLTPWRVTLQGRWLGPDAKGAQPLQQMGSALAGLLPLRIAGSVIFVSLFVFGPLLTYAAGIGMALLIVAPVVYAVNLAAGGYSIFCARTLMMASGRARWLALDAVLCPPYGAGWAKRVAATWPDVGAPLQAVEGQLPESVRESFVTTLRARREESA